MSSSRYLDDFQAGERFRTDGITLTESDVMDFGLKYDPQPFHLDVNAAPQSPYGGLIASGFQTVVLCFRLFIQRGLIAESSIGSPGLDELQWLAPVRLRDTLHTKAEVVETKPSSSKPDQGIMKIRYAAYNQHGDRCYPLLAFIC